MLPLLYNLFDLILNVLFHQALKKKKKNNGKNNLKTIDIILYWSMHLPNKQGYRQASQFGLELTGYALRLSLESPSSCAARTLTLVAKCLQNLANLVEFGAKVSTS